MDLAVARILLGNLKRVKTGKKDLERTPPRRHEIFGEVEQESCGTNI